MSDKKKSEDKAAPVAGDFERLASEYVDLWEQQIKAFSNDEALARTMAQTMELMNAGAANVAAMMQKVAADAAGAMTQTGTDDATNQSAGGNARGDQGARAAGAGAKAAGAASGGSEPDVRELTQRIAELERRLSRLEGLTEPAGKIASGKAAKR